jgi:hypothetical protein
MSTWNPKQIDEGTAPAVQRFKTAKAAVTVLAKSSEHVCTPACTHERANKELAAPTRVKGTLHVAARISRPDDRPDDGSARNGR